MEKTHKISPYLYFQLIFHNAHEVFALGREAEILFVRHEQKD